MQHVTIFTHGKAKSNPGPAAIAIRVVDATGKMLSEVVESIGNANDSYAAFTAVAKGLATAQQELAASTSEVQFKLVLSNEEVKQQLNGELPITNPGIVPFFIEIHNLQVSHFPNLTFTYTPESENTDVHTLVNEVLDAQ